VVAGIVPESRYKLGMAIKRPQVKIGFGDAVLCEHAPADIETLLRVLKNLLCVRRNRTMPLFNL
jgi:hypothetical protein